MEIDDNEEMRSSPPLEVKRDSEEKDEPFDLIDLVEPVDAPTFMGVSRKRPRWAQQTLQDVEWNEATQNLPRIKKHPDTKFGRMP